MPRIEPLSGARAPLLLRLFNVLLRRVAGREIVPFNIMGYSPGLLLPYVFMTAFTRGGKLDPRVRLLAMHRVSELNGCSWCLDYGSSLAPELDIPLEKLRDLANYQNSTAFTPRERAAIAFAEAVTQVGGGVDDTEFADLKHHFSDREIVELLAALCAENFFNRFNVALEVESQGFCALPPLTSAA